MKNIIILFSSLLFILNLSAQNSYTIMYEGGLEGVKNSAGEIIIEPKFKEVKIKNNLAILVNWTTTEDEWDRENFRYSIYNLSTNKYELKDLKDCEIFFTNDDKYLVVDYIFEKYNKKGIHGYKVLDMNLKEVFKTSEYDLAGYVPNNYFNNTFLIEKEVDNFSQYGLIDIKGNILVELGKYQWFQSFTSKDGLILASNNPANGENDVLLLNYKGELILPSGKYNKISPINEVEANQNPGFITEDINGAKGIIDLSGNEIIPTGDYSSIELIPSSSTPEKIAFIVKKGNEEGVISLSKEILLPLGEYTDIKSHYFENAVTCKKGEITYKYYIDLNEMEEFEIENFND